jgi:hypothetical protein
VDQGLKIAALIVGTAAVAVGGWIGYRATEHESSRVCFPVKAQGVSGIECMDPDNPDSFRLTYLSRGKVSTAP